MARDDTFARRRRAEKISAAFQAALGNARRVVRRHQRRVSPGAGEVLGVISEKLREPRFDGDGLRRACPPDSEAYRQFRVEMGRRPVAYLDERRFEIARDLVRDSRVRVHEIARRLGFSDPKLFTSWFKQRAGLAPQSLRAELGTGAAALGHPEAGDEWPDAQIWQMCLLGRAGREATAGLVRLLRRTYPPTVDRERRSR